MKKIKQIMPEDYLSIFMILCPILDIASFIFRNVYKTNYSISTFIRPIIPILIFLNIFFKEKKQNKVKIIEIAVIYVIYAVIHLWIYKNLIRTCSFGSLLHEGQYIINYSFMILNLFIYIYSFDKTNCKKLNNSIIISMAIYIISIYISIITRTSSSTYIEGIGYKGWFESGNSISAILLLSMFIILSFIFKNQNKKIKYVALSIILVSGLYLLTLIGTRVGLIGFVLAIGCFMFSQLIEKIIKKIRFSKRAIIISAGIVIAIIIGVIVFGSVTIQRRKHLQKMETTIIDESSGKISNLTGDLTIIRNKIINDELDENFMTVEQKESIIDLYDMAKKYNVSNTNTRIQQLIYNCMLIKNQKNIGYILFGNGYLINTNELVWEMEFPAILFNFGVIGFILYMVPLISIMLYAVIEGIKNYKKIDSQYIMLVLTVGLSFALSTLSGYTFFNSSSMIIIIIANCLLSIKIKEIKGGKTMQKKLVFGITSLTIGGAERVLVDIVNSINKKYDVTILTLYSKGELEKDVSKNVHIINVFRHPYSEYSKIKKICISINLLLFKRIIYKKYIKNKYNTEIAFLEGPITRLFSIKNCTSKKIAWVHNDISKVFGKKISAKIKRKLDKIYYSNYNNIVFVSKDNKNQFEKMYKINNNKIVISNYISSSRILEEAEYNCDDIFEKKQVNFLIVARLVYQKALDRLIKVHSQLIKDGIKHNFYVIGDGPEREKLKRMIEDYKVNDTFHLLGKRQNPYPYIKNCDIFALLSYYEGYGMVLDEAKILEKPILITNTAAREAIKNYNKVFIADNSEEGIYKGIKECFEMLSTWKQLESISYSENNDIIKQIEKLVE